MTVTVTPDVAIQTSNVSAQDIEAMRQAAEITANAVPMVVIPVVCVVFVLMSWLILHYVTKWRQAKTLTSEDETLLDDLHDTARRLDDRLNTIERIMAADRLTDQSQRTSKP